MYFHGLLYPPDCNECPLMNEPKVYPDGPIPADIAFCGEEPGGVEVRQGRGFVGPSGQLLWKLCEQADISRDEVWVTNASLCVRGDTWIPDIEGRVQAISEIVKGRLRGPYLSLGYDGLLHPDEAVGWHETELGDRGYYRINFKAKIEGVHGMGLTGDHEVLTQRGYVQVKKVQPEKDVVASGLIQPSPEGQSFLLGILLGKGVIRKYRGEKRFNVHIPERSAAYREILVTLLKCIGLRKTSDCSSRAFVSYSHYFKMLLYRYHWDHRLESKRFSPELFTLDPPMLASWFLSSGYAEQDGARLELHGFRPLDVTAARHQLLTVGLVGSIVRTSFCGCIKLDALSAKKLYTRIAPYIPNEMTDLLPSEFRGRFDPAFLDGVYGQPIFMPVKVKKLSLSPREKFYCLTMKNNPNFLTSSFLAHNCRAREIKLPSGAILPLPVVKAMAAAACRRRLLHELIQVGAKVVIPVGNWALWSLSDIPNARIFAYRGSRIDADFEGLLERIDRGLARSPMREIKD